MKKNTLLQYALVCGLLAVLCAKLYSDVIDGPTEFLEQIRNPLASVWQKFLPPFSLSDSKLNAIVKCDPVYSRGLHGYPRSTGMMKGICDTVTIAVQLTIRGATPYVLNGNSPSDWFAPRLYSTTSDIIHDAPAVDSVDLGYRQRGWLGLSGLTTMPDTLNSDAPSIQLLYDVWDIPEGLWVLTVGTTSKTPNWTVPIGLDS